MEPFFFVVSVSLYRSQHCLDQHGALEVRFQFFVTVYFLALTVNVVKTYRCHLTTRSGNCIPKIPPRHCPSLWTLTLHSGASSKDCTHLCHLCHSHLYLNVKFFFFSNLFPLLDPWRALSLEPSFQAKAYCCQWCNHSGFFDITLDCPRCWSSHWCYFLDILVH